MYFAWVRNIRFGRFYYFHRRGGREPTTINCNCTCVPHRHARDAGTLVLISLCAAAKRPSPPRSVLRRHSGVILTRWQRYQQIKDRVSSVIRAVRKRVRFFSIPHLVPKIIVYRAIRVVFAPVIYMTNFSGKDEKRFRWRRSEEFSNEWRKKYSCEIALRK